MINNNKINKTECAELLGITKQRITQLVKSGKLVFGKDGKISAEDAKAQYNKTKERVTPNTVIDTPEDESLTYFKTQTEKFRSKIEEINFRIKSGELLEKEDVKQDAYAIGLKLKNSLLSIPERISSNLAVESNPAKIREVLINEINYVLGQIADDLQKV